jgi:predicted metal-binding protein
MKSKLVVMLTQNDITLKNALSLFEKCQDLPVKYWGFKNIGLPENDMSELIATIKKANKKAVLEVVTYTEESCMEMAKFACDYGFDYLIGTLYYPKVWEYLKFKQIIYHPFVGNVYENPSILTGSPQSMVSQADYFYEKGIQGVNLLAYRYCGGNPEYLAKQIVKQIKTKTLLAGSIDSVERIKIVNNINPWGFTIGSALVTEKFVKGGGYRANLEKVIEIMDSLESQVA